MEITMHTLPKQIRTKDTPGKQIRVPVRPESDAKSLSQTSCLLRKWFPESIQDTGQTPKLLLSKPLFLSPENLEAGQMPILTLLGL